VLGRAWSTRAAERAIARALTAARIEGGASFPATGADARPRNVVIRATGLTWHDHLVALVVFSAFAALVGALVATVWRIVVPGH